MIAGNPQKLSKWSSTSVTDEKRERFLDEVLTPANLRRVFWTIICFLPLSTLFLLENLIYSGDRALIVWGISDVVLSVVFLCLTRTCLKRASLGKNCRQLVIAYYVYCLSSVLVYYFLSYPVVGETPIYAVGVILPAVLYRIPTRRAIQMLVAVHLVYTGFLIASARPFQEFMGVWVTASFGVIVAGLAAYFLFSREWKNYQQLKIIERNNEDLIQLNQQLQDQKEEMNHIMALAAHDLRSPLLNMKNLFDALGTKSEWNKPPYAEVLQVSQDCCSGQLRLLKSLLDSYRAEQGLHEKKRIPVDLVELLEEVQSDRSSKDQPIEFLAKADAAKIVSDPAALHQILENLLSNAVKFSPEGSAILLSLSKDANAWIIEIADEGPGIPEEERSQLFHKFYRSSSNTPSQQGVGLGLFIVSQLAKHLGGSIAYRDRSPRGAVFSLRLPDTESGGM